ncbi:hypothetical protein AB0F77_16125 [Streptomyces sp. NPDC026672]|uniref:hypothetical protein n=1 Tax=unclassified Streptomyces TaxID=2593676 RepID=UPI00340912C1
MPHFVCRHCGDDVPTRPGFEMTAAAQHAKEAGHPNKGVTLATRTGRRPAAGWVEHRRKPSARRQKWDAYPLHVRGAVALALIALAVIAAVWIDDRLDGTPNTPPPCHGGFPVRRVC